MPFYCKRHEDFEGLTIVGVHDHIDKDHKGEIQVPIAEAPYSQSYLIKQAYAKFFADNIEHDDIRRSDSRMVVRTWGRPPKMGQWVTDSEIEKKK